MIPRRILDQDVIGLNLAPGTFQQQLEPGPTLLLFLRHFG